MIRDFEVNVVFKIFESFFIFFIQWTVFHLKYIHASLPMCVYLPTWIIFVCWGYIFLCNDSFIFSFNLIALNKMWWFVLTLSWDINFGGYWSKPYALYRIVTFIYLKMSVFIMCWLLSHCLNIKLLLLYLVFILRSYELHMPTFNLIG